MYKSNSINDSTIPVEKREKWMYFLARELRVFKTWAEGMVKNLDKAEELNDVVACQAEMKLHQAETMWRDYYENVKCLLLDHGQESWYMVSDIHDEFSKGSALIISYLKVIKEQKERKISLVEWHRQKREYMSMTL